MKLLLIIACLAVIITGAFAEGTGPEFYVSVSGSDENLGTKDKPFATLERARDAVRALKPRPGGVTVWIRGGTYCRSSTFELTAGDGGRKDAPIVYRAYPGEEVRITGGREIAGFKPITDTDVLSRIDPPLRDSILQCDLRALGITDFGRMISRGFGRASSPAALELFFRGKPMTLARWPNEGWAKIADVPGGANGGKFTYEGDRPARWTKSDDVWLHGYWTWDWAESYEKVKAIDPQAKEIATEPPHGIYGYKKGARYCALNILEELDQPGEWYLDRKSGILYFLPPDRIRKGDVWVSILEEPFVRIEGGSFITFRGITFECARGSGFVISGGGGNLVAGCAFRNLGNSGVQISGGSRNGVVGCDIYQVGECGIVLGGGDRKTLSPAGNFAENNHISNFSRWVRTYRPAIAIDGVGNRIAHNLIHDAPHSAIILHGNEHVIEYNDIHHVCMETSDAGGFYLGRDFTERGNIVRYNYFHHMGTADVRSVYLDDDASNVRVFGNVFYKAKMGVCIGGGRDNVVENNIFVDCVPSVHVDNRGENWAKPTVDGLMRERVDAVGFRQPPWSVRYPALLGLYDDDPGAPKYNTIERNISFGGKWLNIYSKPNQTISIKDNLLDVDPDFVDPAHEDFRLREDSPAWKLGFKQIPMERIGLYMDEYRTSLPKKETRIRKLGTIDVDLVEATPVVFRGKLYRFEYVRKEYKPNTTGDSYFRFVDVTTGEPTPAFAKGYHLGSAFVEGDTAYVYGVNIWDGDEIRVFWSRNLKNWESATALKLPNWGIFNTSVCKGKGRYVMAFEIDKPADQTGVPFTIRFAESKDLRTWKLTPPECVYSKDRYTACPALRFLDGYYYMIYLEAFAGPSYNPHIVRSKDLINWESSPLNPIMRFSAEDKLIANPKLTAEDRERIQKAEDINNSDVDLCEFGGKTIIYYSWGNQRGIEHLAEAVYDAPLADFLKSWFPR